ncbi:MAG: 3'-5' exonuclease [Kineosporiaceae bacterium]
MTQVQFSSLLMQRMTDPKSDVPARLVVSTISKLREDATRDGLDLKRPRNSRDDRARTCRVNDGWRMVLCDAGTSSSGERVLVALDVLEHDAAYAWCERHRFAENVVTGGFDVVDVASLETVGSTMASVAAAQPERRPLFDGVRDRELRRLSVPAELIPALRQLNDERQLDGLSSLLPPPVRDALAGLASGMGVEEVWEEIQRVHAAPGAAPRYDSAGDAAGSVVEDHLEPAADGALAAAEPGTAVTDSPALADAALSPSSGSFLRPVTDDDELLAALEAPLARWRVFLHPRQQAAARRPTYSGPARVTGGPGTGKSIVAVHRVAHLLERARPEDRLLLTTFTKSLRHALQANLVELVGDEQARRVDVKHLDGLPNHLAREIGLSLPRPVPATVARDLWDEAAGIVDTATTPQFLGAEFAEVVEPQRLESLEAYLAADRRGRGSPLLPAARERLWPAFDHVRRALAARGAATFPGRVDLVTDTLAERGPVYRHVVVDEAQDLTPGHWRMLRALVAPGADDLFIAGDGHQRIYAASSSLSRLGIETRGRSTRLSINYRSTEQILRWSAQIMTGQPVADLDGGRADLSAYRSILQGETPRLVGCATAPDEARALVDSVRTWLADGVQGHEIAVAGRTRSEVRKAHEALRGAGIEATVIEGDDPEIAGHVVVSTMHRMKGLEYRCVHVFMADNRRLPLRSLVASAEATDRKVGDVLMAERSLLYVACTRAREALTLSWTGMPTPFIA